MPKINREEYEILKGLDVKWKWIARDKNESLFAYSEKPPKDNHSRDWGFTGDEWHLIGEILFQFIQWEDEEPYNIAELIEEYESEETEVKKNIEWLKEEIGELPCVDTVFNSGGSSYIDSAVPVMTVYDLLDQLDEPEVLSEGWIREHTWNNHYVGRPFIYADDLQNLLVPKQEEVDRAYRKGFKEGERQTAEYFESITEEPSKEQVWKYLSEHGIEVVDKEPETVADVVADFFKSLERLKEVMSMEVEELEE